MQKDSPQVRLRDPQVAVSVNRQAVRAPASALDDLPTTVRKQLRQLQCRGGHLPALDKSPYREPDVDAAPSPVPLSGIWVELGVRVRNSAWQIFASESPSPTYGT
jgi:hypothetical protein